MNKFLNVFVYKNELLILLTSSYSPMTCLDLQNPKQGSIPDTEKNVLNRPVIAGITVIVTKNAIVNATTTHRAFATDILFSLNTKIPMHGAKNDIHHRAQGSSDDFTVLMVAFCVVRPRAR